MQRLTAALLILASAEATLLRPSRGAAVSEKQPMVGLDRDGKTEILIQVGAALDGPVCDRIKCADPLACPPGFQITEVQGHCCPYCINPDIKIEKKITGATGETGGKQSKFCSQVWCFPTMCLKEEVMPTTKNGLCCPSCPGR
eukprot:TRINITY_DN7397_c0_g2_i1.p1 TRINITY_DN7397_c0_g2~~TRINITY_DN7397_c0_g2_i1.p1  ORF type:complete len:143 (-),score=19.85 TRINITY_DN7397_c0_g2_i1:53-481(-)